MKNIKFFQAIFLALFFATAACSLPAQSTETRSVRSFNNLAVSGNFELITLEKGSESVQLKGSSADLEKIEVENDGNTLEIKLKKGKNLKGKVYIVVSFQNISKIANSGSSDFKTNSTIAGRDLSLAFSGSGDFKGNLDVENLKIAISGSADFDLDGEAGHQDIAISGSGDVDASGLKGKDAKVAISGSGDVDLNVSGSVKSAVSGSGDVTNRG